jgi:hypothetical protein
MWIMWCRLFSGCIIFYLNFLLPTISFHLSGRKKALQLEWYNKCNGTQPGGSHESTTNHILYSNEMWITVSSPLWNKKCFVF